MTDEEREHYERLAKYYASKSSKEPKSIYEHIKLLANDYKCWDNTLTHDEAIELDRLINRKGQWKRISPAKIYECSECGQNVMTDNIECYKFCHGCGARMGEE